MDGDSFDIAAQDTAEPVHGSPLARLALLDEVLRYWNGLRKGHAAPCRAELDPRGLAAALEFCFIGEFIAPGMVRMRVAGAHLSDLMGLDVRGMPLSCLFEPDARTHLATALNQVQAHGRGVRLALSASAGFGRPAFGGALLLLPLRDGRGRLTRLLGCLVTEGTVGRCPRRMRLARPVPQSVVASEPPQPAVPQSPTAPVHACRDMPERGHLRLVFSAGQPA